MSVHEDIQKAFSLPDDFNIKNVVAVGEIVTDLKELKKREKFLKDNPDKDIFDYYKIKDKKDNA